MHAPLAPWPNWNQLTDATADGLPSENASMDCGPESVAEVLYYLTGISLEADYIKDVAKGQGYIGYTSFDDLAGYLQTRASTPTKTYSGDATTLLQPTVQAALSAGHPLIVLFFFDTVHLTGGHFCPVVECGDQHVVRSNPWTGQQETFLWADFERITQYGQALECLRTRDPQLPLLSAPPPVVVPGS